MKQHSSRIAALLGSLLIITLVLLTGRQVMAQGLASNIRGDYGLRPGSQPPPGFYWTSFYYDYRPDEIRTADGGTIRGAELKVKGYFNDFFYVTKKKFLGANYGVRFVLPLLNTAIDTPVLDRDTGFDLSDVYIEPLNLGWHTTHLDAVAIYGLMAPSGRFNSTRGGNTGLGQWANMFSGGFTLYADQGRHFHAGTIATYEIDSEKRDSDAKVGNTLTLEGGIGGTFLKGAITAGAAYYTQWKMTEDENIVLPPTLRGKHRYIGWGPEGSFAFGKRYPVILTARYLFETGNRVATQGDTFVGTLTFVIPTGQ